MVGCQRFGYRLPSSRYFLLIEIKKNGKRGENMEERENEWMTLQKVGFTYKNSEGKHRPNKAPIMILILDSNSLHVAHAWRK